MNDTVGLLPPDGAPYNVDQWDGYTDDRREMFQHLRDNGVTDTRVHHRRHPLRLGVRPARRQGDLPGTRNSVGVEFVATSVTSNNLKDITGTPRRTTSVAVEEVLKANNPHIKYLNFDDHGFSVLDITAKRAQMDWFIIGDRADKGAGASWTASWATTAGSQTSARSTGRWLMRGRGKASPATDRRTLLKVAGASGAALAVLLRAGRPSGECRDRRKRAYVLVIDGCRPGEIDAMPNARRAARRRHLVPRGALAAGDGDHPQPRDDDDRVPAGPERRAGQRDLRPRRRGAAQLRPSDRHRVATIIEQLNASGRTTGTVLSKEYLYWVFGTARRTAGSRSRSIPVTGHAPDLCTMDAAIAMVEEFDPDMVFVNLGDVDRVGHSDLTGTTLKAARRPRWPTTEPAGGPVRRHAEVLGAVGTSMVIVLADHSMDWSLPHEDHQPAPRPSTPTRARRQVPDRPERRRGPRLLDRSRRGRAARSPRCASLALGDPRRASGARRQPDARLRLGANAGDLLVYCKAGWRFSDPGPQSNPIPGNHGHPASEPIPFFVGGGSPPWSRASPGRRRRTRWTSRRPSAPTSA